MNIDRQKSFDKPPHSYWMASTPKTGYPVLDKDIKVDVAIVGGGIAGITCAYFLEKEGLKTAVLEADHIAQGTTGHTTAKITSQHALIYNKIKNNLGEERARQYADANETAIREIRKVIEENRIDCDFTPQAAYVYTQQDNYVQQIQDEVKTASALGIPAAFEDKIPFPIPIKAAVRFDHQAQFHPRKYLLALARMLEGSDCHIYEQSRIVNLEEGNGYVLSTAEGKKVTAEKVIIASHYPFYNKSGFYFTRIFADRSYVVAVKAKEQYPGGMYISAEEPTRSLRYQNTDEGELILVGGEHHKTGQGKETTKHYEALVDFANSIFTVEDIPYRWSTQDCMTLDDLPYVGHFTSDTPNLYIATGYAKWGMTNSMVSALLLRDLITQGRSPWQEAYNPSRHTFAASAKNFIVENADVAKELIGVKLAPVPDHVSIQQGEGKIVEVRRERAGVYRDNQDQLHIVNPTCTHMGCELHWNAAEKSWDCPCHGSRFTYEGDIAEGPTVKPLDPHKDVNTLEKLIKDQF